MKESDRAWTTSGIDAAMYAALADSLSDSALSSLLLEVMARRAGRRTPTLMQSQWEHDRFVQPAYVDQRTLTELDGHLLAAAGAFEAIELSPLAPLGACSSVAVASQNKIVSALRGTEVVSDPTNVLALESARRLHANPSAVVRLATCHRCVRAQEVPKQPGFAAHFRIFCLTSAGKERKDHAFTVQALIEHITTHLVAWDRLEPHGYAFPHRSLTLLATEARERLADRIADAMTGLPVTRARLDHPYYDGLRFTLAARATSGQDVPLTDGGTFDWLRTLGSNDKLVFVASGMGSQLAALLFRAGA